MLKTQGAVNGTFIKKTKNKKGIGESEGIKGKIQMSFTV